MANELVNTLWGLEVLNPAPMCKHEGCENHADNAGNGKYHKLCSHHHRAKYQKKRGGLKHLYHRKEYCENVDGRLGYKCTTTIVNWKWQLEVDHIDGNSSNDNPLNYQTLCSCCHRYKTYLNEENLSPEKRKSYLQKFIK